MMKRQFEKQDDLLEVSGETLPMQEDNGSFGYDPEKEQGIADDSETAGDCKENPDTDEHRKWKETTVISALICFLILYIFSFFLIDNKDSLTIAPENEIAEEFVSVTERTEETMISDVTAESGTSGINSENQEDENKGENPAAGTETITQDLSWQDTIFGRTGTGVINTSIKVSGLTENERNLVSFRESDFIRSAAVFLTANNIHTGRITFTGSAACSAGAAAAYEAELSGVSGQKLLVVFYPKYPGKYLFMLMKQEVKTVEKTKETDKPSQTETRGNSQGTQILSQQIITAPQIQTQTQAQSQTEPEYDASRLSLNGMSGELGNYLVNSVELQYELYDYLYHHGVKNVTSAVVNSYYIDPEDRTATIEITVTGSGDVTAVYDRDSNTYSFW